MRGNMLSRRYAVALAEIAEKGDGLERVRGELDGLAAALTASRHFAILVNSPAQGRSAMKAVFRTLSERLNLSGATARLFDYLVDKQRAGLLPKIAESFSREADRRLGIMEAHVTSAVALTEAQRQTLTRELERTTQSRIRLIERTDESLIAGFQVKLDGRFFDGTLRGRLDRITETIIHGE